MTETRERVHELGKEAKPGSLGDKSEGLIQRGGARKGRQWGLRDSVGSPSPPETCLPPCRVRGPLLALAGGFQDHG